MQHKMRWFRQRKIPRGAAHPLDRGGRLELLRGAWFNSLLYSATDTAASPSRAFSLVQPVIKRTKRKNERRKNFAVEIP